MPIQNKQSTPSSSSKVVPSETLPKNAIQCGDKNGKLRIMRFTDVKDGIAITPTNDLGIKPVTAPAVPFKGQASVNDDFSVKDYSGNININVCAAYLSDSKELKEKVKNNSMVTVQLSDTNKIYIVHQITSGNVKNALSFNKACSVMAYNILRMTTDEVFDWSEGKYVKLNIEKKSLPDSKIINRLASVMNITPSDPYHYLVVPGYEFLYEVYPSEVIGLTMARLNNKGKIRMPDDVSDEDMISSLVAKMNKKHDLSITSIDQVFKIVGEEHIKNAYEKFNACASETSKNLRNIEIAAKFREMISKFSAI